MGKQVIESIEGNRLLIGIDPGKVTGICILKYNDEFPLLGSHEIRSLYTLDFWSTYFLFSKSVPTLIPISQIHIEQPSLIRSLYARHSARLEETKSKIATRDKIVWDSGANAREGTLLRDGLRNLGFTVFDCRPVGRRKWTSEQFQSITGYPDRSNQHVRDAAFLVWDKQWQEFLQT